MRHILSLVAVAISIPACGAGPTNKGGLPTPDINTGGAPDISKSGLGDGGTKAGAPDFGKTNTDGLPGGNINTGGAPDPKKTNTGGKPSK